MSQHVLFKQPSAGSQLATETNERRVKEREVGREGESEGEREIESEEGEG